MLVLGLLATALGADILVYGPTNGANGQIESTLRNDPDNNHNVTVWNEVEWRAATTEDFAAFDAIVVGDPNCGGPEYATYQAIYDTRETWSPVVRGNILVAGTDAGCHFSVDDAIRDGQPTQTQVRQFFRQAVAWAASGNEPGMYVSSDWNAATQPTEVPAGSTASVPGLTFMTAIADIRSDGYSTSEDFIDINDTGDMHPVFDGITNIGMSDWRTTFHSYFPPHSNFPNDFIGLTTNMRNGSPGRFVLHLARRECDFDQDGFDAAGDSCGGTDCDDDAPAVNPDAIEVCDGIDNNCVGGIDEAGAVGSETYWQDNDRDGYGNPAVEVESCSQPPLFTTNNLDCRDDVPSANPDGVEVPYDGIDNDCEGGDTCDLDGDGFDEDGEFCGGQDCDDTDSRINPNATEVFYNGIDQDCLAPGDYDQDGDGFDSAAELAGGTDCDDFDDTVYPGAPELPDQIDNDCNGYAEHTDTDGDGALDEDELLAGTDPESADSDSDGVPDGLEIGDPADPTDTDGDGIIDALDPDDDGDGINTSVEIGDWTAGPLPDADEDGIPNHQDLDSDGDGFRDSLETATDSDSDGLADFIDTDSDNDTVPDSDERPDDTDDDGLNDRIDADDDGDGIPTETENSVGNPDVDGDTVANWLDDDTDSDGRRDEDEGDGDTDCDDILNFADADDLDGPCAQPDEVLRGGSCSTVPGGMALWLGLLAIPLVRRRR